MANNPNAAANLTKPFQPGQSGNPGGISSEMKRMHMRAAEIVARLRLAELEAQEAALANGVLPGVNADNRGMWKDAEDRGLGAPKQTVEADVGFTKIRRIIMKEE
jgi:hypothetical protein